MSDTQQDTTPQCTVSWFTDGGRTEKQCPEPAEAICKDCGEGRCDEHQGDSDHALTFYRLADGFTICEECISDEQREGSEEVSTWRR